MRDWKAFGTFGVELVCGFDLDIGETMVLRLYWYLEPCSIFI